MKIYFVDFWPAFDINNNFITKRLIQNKYTFSIDPNPDFLFCSSFGHSHFKYENCIKIYFTGENNVPDFNIYDYGIGFHHIQFQDRYLRFPLYLWNENLYKSLSEKKLEENILNRKFCNFLYTNNKQADPIREKFFIALNKYKKVDSGGRFLNNLGHGVKNKFSFIQDYKFTIAFENSSVSGYTTEKLVDPMSVNSLPIYWGNPDVNLDFNINSILHLKNENQIEEIIAQIIYLDTNDVAYSKKLKEPWLKNNLTLETWIEKLDIFLHNIFKTSSRRITTYGYNSFYFTEQKFASRFLDFPIIRKIVKNI